MDLWIVVRPAVVTQLWRGSVKCPLYCETTVKRQYLSGESGNPPSSYQSYVGNRVVG